MTTTPTHETEIVADPDVPLIRIVREFDAPPEQVFRAHTDPALLVRWMGPRGTETDVEQHECRRGGAYRYAHRSGDLSFAIWGSFHEVRPAELLVQTESMDLEPADDGVALVRTTFESIGDGRTRLTSTTLVDSFAGRDAIIASGMEHGVKEGYERLDELLGS